LRRSSTHVPQLVQDSLMEPLSGALSYRDAAKIVRHRVPGQVGVNAHRSWFQVTAVSCVAGVLELFPQLEGNQMSSRRPGSRPVGGCSERLGGGGPRWRDPVCQWPGGVAVPLCPRRPTRPAHRDAGPESVRSVHAAHREGYFAPRGSAPGTRWGRSYRPEPSGVPSVPARAATDDASSR